MPECGLNDPRSLLVSSVLLVGAGLWLFSRRSLGGVPAPVFQEPDFPRDWRATIDSTLSNLAETADAIVADLGDTVSQAISTGPWDIPARGEPYRAAIVAAEDRHGIPRNLLARLLYQESHFRPDVISGATRSPAGALGIAQFMPATAAELGIDPLNPAQAIDAAGKYLASLYKKFRAWPEALAAYNWGQGNVDRKGIAAAPLETRRYVAQITGDVPIA